MSLFSSTETERETGRMVEEYATRRKEMEERTRQVDRARVGMPDLVTWVHVLL